MLYLAQYFNMPIGEVAVTWQEIDGKFLYMHIKTIILNGFMQMD